MSDIFKLNSKFDPRGDQPEAIKKLTKGVIGGKKHQTLLGVTGSGKTFSIANVIEKTQKPTLIISHNKTLTAQLYEEFKEFFPDNAVRFFVSYYDYYQPEAYIPKTDTYIEKDASINEEIDKFRHASTSALLTRKDVIVVASVSCIYGIGDPKDYFEQSVILKKDTRINRNELIKKLIEVQYERNDIGFQRGKLRAKGDSVDIFPPYEEFIYRIGFYGNSIESIKKIDPISGHILDNLESLAVFPAKHFVTTKERVLSAIDKIRSDMVKEVSVLKKRGQLLEAQRLEQRTIYDLEMLEQTGYCSGIENYSIYLSDRKIGDPPYTLINFFSEAAKKYGKNANDYLLVIDESHITIPQIRGMYNGDRSRKETLVEHGFRLSTAKENRPLKFVEFENLSGNVIYTSATPEEYEIGKSTDGEIKTANEYYLKKEKGEEVDGVTEQLIRPTGLIDPEIEVRETKYQIDDLISEILKRVKKNQRVLITTLTKRMAEDLTDYLKEAGIKVQYLHSDIDTLERPEILKNLRLGHFDVLIGINLLREGLDLPEVSLVIILDADKEGFLRSDKSLIQTIGRAARHKEGKVIMYADKITGSMERAIEETKRRRKVQSENNEMMGIKPKTIVKEIREGFIEQINRKKEKEEKRDLSKVPKDELKRLLKELEQKMDTAAKNLDFEKAAFYRDQIIEIEEAQNRG